MSRRLTGKERSEDELLEARVFLGDARRAACNHGGEKSAETDVAPTHDRLVQDLAHRHLRVVAALFRHPGVRFLGGLDGGDG